MKVLYQYNKSTCQYEPISFKPSYRRRKAILFWLGVFFISVTSFNLYILNFDSFDEIILQVKNHQLQKDWKKIDLDIKTVDQRIKILAQNDDTYYRSLLSLNPLSGTQRQAGAGGHSLTLGETMPKLQFVNEHYARLLILQQRIQVQMESMKELEEAARAKKEMLASVPAIQPVHNKQLERLHLTYGERLHPLFFIWRDHKGLDFSAARGTPVYATGDGKIQNAYFSSSYGNVVYVDHGFDYETRYAHLTSYSVSIGQHVKRGEIIGYVGSTGHSKSSHLHYEVLYKGSQVNPINFFDRSLSLEEYDKLISRN
ncbi:MAG: M23 family metallopeptidase [Flammeovirgaceae bacterium]|nr:M23 family metallopeptidase [Flammeovirgaceae bacterium]